MSTHDRLLEQRWPVGPTAQEVRAVVDAVTSDTRDESIEAALLAIEFFPEWREHLTGPRVVELKSGMRI
jgi:hypothetical protein